MRRRRLPATMVLGLAGIMGIVIAAVAAGPMSQGRALEIILGLVGLAVIIGALASLEVALLALIAVAFMDGFAKSLVVSPASLLAKDILLMAGLAHWMWMGLTEGKWSALRLPIILPAFVFTLYCIAEMFNTETGSYLVALAGLRSWVIWLGVALLGYEYIQKRAHIERIFFVIMVLALGTGIYGIYQYNVGFGHLYALSDGFSYYNRFSWGEGVRAVSTFVGPGSFGDAMSLSAIACIGAVMYVRGKQWLKVLLVAVAALCLVGLATSGSRAPLLGLVVGGMSLLVLVRRPQLLVGSIVVGVLAVVVLNTYAGGAFEARYNPKMVNYWVVMSRSLGPLRQGMRSALERPLGVGVATGVGVGRGLGMVTSQSVRVRSTAGGMVESEYGRALRELGLPGFALFIWLLYTTVKMALVSFARAQTAGARSLIAGCIGIIVSTVARLAVGSALYMAPSGLLFWLAAVVAVRCADIEESERAELYEHVERLERRAEQAAEEPAPVT